MKRTVCEDFGGLTDGLKWNGELLKMSFLSFHTSVARLVFDIMSYTLVLYMYAYIYI